MALAGKYELRNIIVMVKFTKVVIIAFFAVISVVSCSLFGKDTGTEDVENPPIDSQPQVEYEPVEYSCEVETEANGLHATQCVVGNMTIYDQSGQPHDELFRVDLGLEASFDTATESVTISGASGTTEVALVSTNVTEEVVEVPTEYSGLIIKQVKRTFEFGFNDGEAVSVATMHEKVLHQSEEFAHTSIETVEYQNHQIYLNQALTTESAMVYDVTLLFEVVLKDNNKPARQSQSHIITVTYSRICELAEVDKVAEYSNYIAQFGTEEKRLYTIQQTVSGDIVSYVGDNTEIGREPFSKDLDVEVNFTVPEVVYVERESQLTEVKLVGSAKSGDTENSREEGGFTITKRAQPYNFNFDAEDIVVANVEYEYMKYNLDSFPYAAVDNINFKGSESTLNAAQTTDKTVVYDVTLYFEVSLKAQNQATLESTSYIVPVTYKRVYERVETYMVAENASCTGEFGVEDKRLYTIDYKVNGQLATYTSSNNEVERVPFSKDLNLSVVFTTPDVVSVETEAMLTDVSLKGSSKSGDTVNKREEDGFTISTTTQPNSFKFNASETVDATMTYEQLQYGQDKLPYYRVESIRYKSAESTLNAAQTTDNTIVYDVTLYFEVSLKQRNVTPAQSQTHIVPVTYKRIYKNNDVVR